MLKIIYLVVPFIISLLLVMNKDKKIVNKPGTIIWAYGLGICFSLIMNFVSKNAFKNECIELLEILAYVSVSIGIPLILFSSSIKNLKLVKKDIKKAFSLLVLSVIIVTLVLYLLYTKNIENGKVLSGMALAIYTGGTPNLNAVAYIFNLNSKVLLAANLSDIVIGGIFFLIMILIAKLFVKKSPADKEDVLPVKKHAADPSKKSAVMNLLIALGLALISAGLGALIWLLTGKPGGRLTDYLVPLLMIGTSLGGIVLAKNEKISSVEANDGMGQFFITLFSFAIASLIDFEAIKNIANGVVFVFLIITIGTFFVHMLLCKLFKIDLRFMMVTSTAGIYGPAFVPGICKALDADQLVPAGLIMGSLGYIIGTFLGCGLIMVLQFIG